MTYQKLPAHFIIVLFICLHVARPARPDANLLEQTVLSMQIVMLLLPFVLVLGIANGVVPA